MNKMVNITEEKNSGEEFEECVSCHRRTDVLKTTDISLRSYYIEGCGQLCRNCYLELQKEK